MRALGGQNKERVRLLHVAADEHQNGYREAMTGKGACQQRATQAYCATR
jgi:hypothetical protein